MPWTIWAYAPLGQQCFLSFSQARDYGFRFPLPSRDGPRPMHLAIRSVRWHDIFHATLFSHTPSRTKCWRSLFCRRVCLPKQLDENVATLHLHSHGAAITVCAEEYVDYVGVKLKALFYAPRVPICLLRPLCPWLLRPGVHSLFPVEGIIRAWMILRRW